MALRLLGSPLPLLSHIPQALFPLAYFSNSVSSFSQGRFPKVAGIIDVYCHTQLGFEIGILVTLFQAGLK
jgi:hypothetical protein